MMRLRKKILNNFIEGMAEELGVSVNEIDPSDAERLLLTYRRFMTPAKAKILGKEVARSMKEFIKDNPEPFVPEPVRTYVKQEADLIGHDFKEVVWSKPVIKYWKWVRGKGGEE